MSFLFNRHNIICPYCLSEIRNSKRVIQCPTCSSEIPILYSVEHKNSPPLFLPMFGWSTTGKTTYACALTLILTQMTNLWTRYSHSILSEASLSFLKQVNVDFANGRMPSPTISRSYPDVYMMALRDMEHWGSRTLIIRDFAGDMFDNLSVQSKDSTFIVRVPVILVFISLSDLVTKIGYSMDMLASNYINTLSSHGVDFSQESRSIIFVLSKADTVQNLPSNISKYLFEDPIRKNISKSDISAPMEGGKLHSYLEDMDRISDSIRDMIYQQPSGKSLLRLTENKGIETRFTIVSSTGVMREKSGSSFFNTLPNRVLDPLFWALELTSRKPRPRYQNNDQFLPPIPPQATISLNERITITATDQVYNIYEDIENLEKLITQHKRRLQKLKEKEAALGLSVDPSIPIEIEDVEKSIVSLKIELANLERSRE